jgi:hypothetical protein
MVLVRSFSRSLQIKLSTFKNVLFEQFLFYLFIHFYVSNLKMIALYNKLFLWVLKFEDLQITASCTTSTSSYKIIFLPLRSQFDKTGNKY